MIPFFGRGKRGRVAKSPRTSRVPILIANGWAPFPLPMHLVRRQYQRLGFEVVVIPFSMKDMRCIDAFARHVTDYVLRFCVERRIAQVNLMGISLGAVAALRAIKRYDLGRFVATFVAVGGPLLGSPLWVAALASGMFAKLGKQLRPYSRFLTDTMRRPWPTALKVVAVGGSKDKTCPVWSALIPGAINITLPFGHGAVLGDRRIPPLVEPHLAREPP